MNYIIKLFYIIYKTKTDFTIDYNKLYLDNDHQFFVRESNEYNIYLDLYNSKNFRIILEDYKIYYYSIEKRFI